MTGREVEPGSGSKLVKGKEVGIGSGNKLVIGMTGFAASSTLGIFRPQVAVAAARRSVNFSMVAINE
jgi:hypothetical protein